MTINFPSNPSLDQIYTFDNRSWRWNGEYWQSITVTVGYTGSQGQSSIFKNSVPTEQDLPIPYGGDIGDGFLVESTGFMWIWDGSSWGSLGRFTGFTGSQGAPGTSVRLIGSVPTEQDLPTDGTSDGSTLLVPGDGFIVQSSGDLYVWSGSDWSNVGKIAGDAGPIGFTGSRGIGIIDTELINDELIITYEDSTQNNVGNVRGFVGSRGESSFTWGPTPPPDPEIGARWFDTTAGILLVYVTDGVTTAWLETAASGFLGQTGYTGSGGGVPKIANVVVLDGIFNDTDDLAVSTTGGTIKLVGTGFEPGCSVLIGETPISSSDITFINGAAVRVNVPAQSAGNYTVYVVNTDGGTGIRINGLRYSQAVSWNTAADLGERDLDFAISIQLAATSDSAVTYSVASGSVLPPGLTLNSSGLLSGTVTGLEEDTVYTFTVVATDQELQDLSRVFSVTITAQVIPSPQLFLNFDRMTALDPRITFTRATSATFFNSSGVLSTATSGAARFDHRLESGVWVNKGLLIEEQRANICLRSEEFQTTWGNLNTTETTNATTAPDGNTTADAVFETTTNALHNISQTITLTSTSGSPTTISVFIKGISRTRGWIQLLNTASGNNELFRSEWDLAAETVTPSGLLGGTSLGGSIQNCGNDWYRITSSGYTGGTSVLHQLTINFRNDAASGSYAGDVTKGYYLWGAQLEAGAFPTSYIKTTTASVTRNADITSMTGTNFSSWYNQTEGSVFWQGDLIGIKLGTSIAFAISDNAFNERMNLITTIDDGTGFVFGVTDGGAAQAALLTPNPLATPIAFQTYQYSTAYKVNDFAASLDGASVATDTSGTLPTVDRIYIGSSANGLGAYLNGHIAKFYYWNRRLLDRNLKFISAADKYENDADLLLDFDETTSLDSRITFTRATSATFFNASGVLTTAGSGVPRFDHRLEGDVWVNKGLLIEEQRANTNQRSEEYNDVYYNKGECSVVSNTQTAPDGTVTADTWIPSNGSTVYSIDPQFAGNFSAASPNQMWSASVFVKNNGLNRFAIDLNFRTSTGVSAGAGGGDFEFVGDSMTSNLIISGTSNVTADFLNVGNGWFRLMISAAGGVNVARVSLRIRHASTNLVTGDGSKSLYIWGSQLELGAFSTSYIKTTTASVTRNQDVVSMTGTNFSSWFNSSEGTMYCAWSNIGFNPVNNYVWQVDPGDGTSAERYYLITTSTGAFHDVIDNNVSQTTGLNSSYTPTLSQNYTSAFAYRIDDFAASFNGNSTVTDTSGTLPTVARLVLGEAQTTATRPLNGHIAKFRYWRERLPNQRLQDMTGE